MIEAKAIRPSTTRTASLLPTGMYRNRRITTPKIASAGGARSDTRRRALVNVRRPQVERNQRQLKAEADDHQPQTRQQQRFVQGVISQAFTQRQEGQVARVRIDQRHTEQQE